MPATPGAAMNDEGQQQRGLRRRRVPPNLFGIAFGLAGLGQAWHAAGPVLGTPHAIPDVINILAAAAWLLLVVGYAAQGPRQILADLRDPVLAPFVPVPAITAMILATALSRDAFAAGRVLMIVFLAVTVAVGGWLTGQWIAGDVDQDSVHPGYFLPTVTGGLVGAGAAVQVHLHAVAQASFGIGILCWIFLASVVMNRLFFRRGLTPALVPTLAIELAPAVVGGSAYFALTGGAVNVFSNGLGGYALLMTLVQVRLIPLYARLSFTPGFWAFTFPYAASVTYTLEWLTLKKPPGATAYATAVIALITAFIFAIAARTVVAAARGQLFSVPPAPPPSAGAQFGASAPPVPAASARAEDPSTRGDQR